MSSITSQLVKGIHFNWPALVYSRAGQFFQIVMQLTHKVPGTIWDACAKYLCPRLIFGAPPATFHFLSGHKIRSQIKCMVIILEYRWFKTDFWWGSLKSNFHATLALKKPVIYVSTWKYQKELYFTSKWPPFEGCEHSLLTCWEKFLSFAAK